VHRRAEPGSRACVVEPGEQLHREPADRRARVLRGRQHRVGRLGVAVQGERRHAARFLCEHRPPGPERVDERRRVRTLDRPRDRERQHRGDEPDHGQLPGRQHIGADQRDHARDGGARL
jgi:hypothetical protein